MLETYEAKIVAPARLVGRQALEIEFLKGSFEKRTGAEKRAYIRHGRAGSLSVAQGCRLMGLPRSTFYETPAFGTSDETFIGALRAICDAFETYGCRRVGATLRHQGLVVNGKQSAARCASATCSPSIDVASWRRRTANATDRSTRVEHAMSLLSVPTSFG